MKGFRARNRFRRLAGAWAGSSTGCQRKAYINCLDAVRRDRNRTSVDRPPPGILKDQYIRLSWLPTAGFPSSFEKSHTSSQNLEVKDTAGFSAPSPDTIGASGLRPSRLAFRLIPTPLLPE